MIKSLEKRGYLNPCLIGKGAFSRVYRVTRGRDGKHFACKVSREKTMLAREGEILRKLRHPLFPKWIEGWEEEEGFLVMEYIAGASLEKLLEKRGWMNERAARKIALSLAEGTAYLHERSNPILYRDFKPANIMIGQDGRVKLVDFGCALCLDQWEAEGLQVRAGTPGFAAPEQLAGGRPGKAGDIYGYGKVLERMCPKEKITAKGRDLSCLISFCTQKEPDRRPASIRQCRYLLGNLFGADTMTRCRIEQYVAEF